MPLVQAATDKGSHVWKTLQLVTMTRERAILLISFLTLVGMIGLYYGMWIAYQKYQEKSDQLGSVNGLLGLFAGK